MNTLLGKFRGWLLRYKAFSEGILSRRNSRVLVRQIHSSLQLQPVALVAELIGASVLTVIFWNTFSHGTLLAWAAFVLVHVYASIEYNRRFLRDRHRHARIQTWVHVWMWIALSAGVIWAVAGMNFIQGTPSGLSTKDAGVIATILAVTFASWPIYACWLPALIGFTIVSLLPMAVRMVLLFDLPRVGVAVILLLVITFIFYSGVRLNEIVKRAVRNEREKELLVKRLTVEKNSAQRLRRESEERSQKHAKFFAAANHDIRQPLQAIGIYTQLLQMNVADEQTRQVVEQLQKTTVSLEQLVNQILEVTRLEMGQMVKELRTVKLKSIFDDLAFEFEPLAKEKGLTFRVKAMDVNIKTDPELLLRALRNLLRNAVAYTQEGEILLAARLISHKWVNICIVDSGRGIAEKDQKRIFEFFYRSEQTSTDSQGYGLGLSIVRVIAQQLKCTVSMNSKLGRGSIFRLQMPVDESEQVRALTLKRLSYRALSTLHGQVVLIEDNALVRQCIKGLLESWSLKVFAEEKMTQTLQQKVLSTQEPLVVVTDYNLGEEQETGLQVLRRLTALKQERIPSILLTAVDTDTLAAEYARELAKCDEKEAMLYAMPRLLQKPASAQELNAALREAFDLIKS